MATKSELVLLDKLQGLIGRAMAAHGNDRDPHGFEKGQVALKKAFTLVVEMRSKYPAEATR